MPGFGDTGLRFYPPGETMSIQAVDRHVGVRYKLWVHKVLDKEKMCKRYDKSLETGENIQARHFISGGYQRFSEPDER